MAARAVAWRAEREACDTLEKLTWASLLPETCIGQWRIVPLTDAWQLRREALTQRHCVDQHLEDCQIGSERVFLVRNGRGKSVATLGLERGEAGWNVCGFRGFANQPVSDDLVGLDVEVLQRFRDLWALTVPAEASLPPQAEPEEDDEIPDGACPYCGEAQTECAHKAASVDLGEHELVGGALYAVYEELQRIIGDKIEQAASNGKFRFDVSEEIRLLAREIANGAEDKGGEDVLSTQRRLVGEMIFDRFELSRAEIDVSEWNFSGAGLGSATTYRCYWARDPGAVIEWLKAQFQPTPKRTAAVRRRTGLLSR